MSEFLWVGRSGHVPGFGNVENKKTVFIQDQNLIDKFKSQKLIKEVKKNQKKDQLTTIDNDSNSEV